MKKTAVDFLVEEISFLKDMNFDFGDGLPKDIIDKAKEMEKEQIIYAAQWMTPSYADAEQYYNETYKSE